jgi:hypothetical protein
MALRLIKVVGGMGTEGTAGTTRGTDERSVSDGELISGSDGMELLYT